MTIKPVENEKEQVTTDSPLSTRIKAIKGCPFDVADFYEANKGLVKKYIRKNTYGLDVPDWDEVPDDWYYRGNSNILRANIKGKADKYTNLQKLEWIKCALDVNYFTKRHIKIISIDDGIIPFRLYDFQEDLLELYQNNRFVISMQCRQSGKTQTTAAYILWYIQFNAAKNCAILANKGSQAQEILGRVQLSYEDLPLYMQQGAKVYNKRSMEIENMSIAFSAASSSSSIRGKSVSLLYIDEAAFIPNDMEFYESTYPVIASGKNSQVIITSTPNGTRGLFYKLWQESEGGTNEYVRKLVTWDMVPGRDEAWKRQTISNTSPEQFRQEHECVSGDSIVHIRDTSVDQVFNIAIGDLYEIMDNQNEKSLKEMCEGREGVIYKITRSDFKEYIGITLNFEKRLYEHSVSPRFKGLGIIDYEILHEGPYYDCHLMEQEYIAKHDTFYNGLNASIDGKGNHLSEKFTTLGMKFSEETKMNISKGHQKRSHYATGWKHSDKTKREWSNKRKGVAVKEKLSKNDVDYIITEFNNFKFSIDDVINDLKASQRKRIEKYGWDGSENLVAKNGHEITEAKVFSKLMAKKYNVTPRCIDNILAGKRTCFKS